MAKAKTCYLPWKGPHYGTRFDRRILIIGESHYDYPGCQDDQFLTSSVFGNFSEGYERNPFRKAVAAAVLGQSKIDAEAYRDFWESVAMYNYVRRLLKEGEQATQMDLRDPEAAVAFTDEVLPSLQPDCVFVFTKKVWDWLPNFGRTDSKIEKEIGCEAGWYSCGSDRYALAVGLTHPSRWKFEGDSPLSVHRFIQKALLALNHRGIDLMPPLNRK
jgi:hypothetical protein